MQAKEYIEKVQNSPVYTEWANQNSGYYLVHLFAMTGHDMQVGYYSKEEDKVVTFVIGEEITQNPPEESFKDSGAIPELELDKVKVDMNEAFEEAKSFQEKEYPKETLDSNMIILQNQDGGPIYNITLITKSLNFINIKLSAEDASVITHKKNSILDLKQENQGEESGS